MKNREMEKPTFQKMPLAAILSENQLVDWILRHGETIFLFFLAFITLFFMAYKWSFGHMVKSEAHYIKSENEYQRFFSEKNPVLAQKNLDNLQSLLKANPELYPKYQGPIAEKLILSGNILESIPFANGAIERTEKENGPYFSDFSKSTFLILEKKYEEALSKSLALKDEMIKDFTDQSNKMLFAFNLLRIANLQQALGLKDNELKTWNEWKLKAKENANDENFQKLINYFSIGQLSLNDFIEDRENFLRKS